jgi:hypothetical protein
MGPGEHRPFDNEYWEAPWSRTLFAGDLFAAIPFGDQPTVLYTARAGERSGKHFVGEIVFAYGLLTTPTCDMAEQHGTAAAAHPYRVLVPVLPLETVVAATAALTANVDLMRSRDTIAPYMYLPPLGDVLDGEHLACLFRPALVSDEFLADPPRRVAQLQAPARRHLKIKLAMYWGRVRVAAPDLPLHERDEEEYRASASPPSRYDSHRA